MSFFNRFSLWLGGAGVRSRGIQSGDSGNSIKSAVPVTMDTALQLSSVWACVKLISETVASLPLKVYKVDAKGVKTEDKAHPLAMMFNGRMNRWQTRQEFFETITYQLAMLGNNYCHKQLDSSGKLIGLVPLMSAQMQVELSESGAVEYQYQQTVGVQRFNQDEIWHNKLFGNGIIGMSPLSYARGTLGIAQAAENSTSKIYKNGGKPSGLLTMDKVLTDVQRQKIKSNFGELAEGNDDRLFVLEAGMKYQQVSLSPQDVELLASRRFQIEDIARAFGVPSVLINDLANATAWGSGIEQIIGGWYKLGLRPILERYQDSMRINLLDATERSEYLIEFDLDELLAPSMAARITSGKEAVQGGLMMPNEWRKKEGLAPVEGGDRLLVQQQMIGLDMIDTVQRSAQNTQQQQQNAMAMAKMNQPQNHIHLPEIKIPDINIPAPIINVAAAAAPVVRVAAAAAPVIHVAAAEAPIVNVAAPVVNVAAADIPEIKVQLPARKTETKVKHDSAGNIVSTSTIETDV